MQSIGADNSVYNIQPGHRSVRVTTEITQSMLKCMGGYLLQTDRASAFLSQKFSARVWSTA